jgi:predicted GH43/DUF377 family glycosyl hydrolase
MTAVPVRPPADRDGVRRSEVVLTPDPARVLARLFVPGRELVLDLASRASDVLERLLALSEPEVRQGLQRVYLRYSDRHRDLPRMIMDHYEQIAHRLPPGQLSAERRAFIGACFTQEYAVEGAALFNPSAVLHPDQSDLPAGHCRFVLSLRAVGEGHLSSVEFRSGTLGPDGQVSIEPAGRQVERGEVLPTWHDRGVFVAQLAEEGIEAETVAFLAARLPARFGDADLDAVLATLSGQQRTRRGLARAQQVARRVVSGSYQVEFPAETRLAERLLWPTAPAESRGMEDARFVRFVDADGAATYRATYTAFDGAKVEPGLIETADFRRFRMSPLAGPAAKNKGMALFPRPVGGRYLALSRWDRETISLTSSTDGSIWSPARPLYGPSQPWELIQTGNCGSPVETEAGWLVLTHGVGALREYSIGALLLDLDEPDRILAALPEPLLQAAPDERDGYVPNVVYSCGALRHDDQLLLPYGASDSSTRFAVVGVDRLLSRLGSAAARR